MKYQDIQISDIDLKHQFVTNWMNGNYTGALTILKINPQLDSKKFTKEAINIIGNSLMALEQIYTNEVPNFLELKLNEYNESINDFIYKQQWNSSIYYKIGNSVLDGEDIYFCIKDNINIKPVEGEYWVKLGLKGDEGAYGLNAIIRYNWIPEVTYKLNDVVVYEDWLWYANQESTGQKPVNNSVYWDKFLKVPKVDIVVSDTQPLKLYDGLIWTKILNT